MKAEKLIADPVFQLNLLIWASLEQPPAHDHYRVNPLFHRAGFRVFYVEQPFAFPSPLQQRLLDIPDITKAPSPDIILIHHEKAQGLYIEAKANSFGVDSKNSQQARAHLIATGPAFTQVYPFVTACRLVYALPEARRDDMAATLAALREEVTQRDFEPGPTSVHGFSAAPGEVRYHLDGPSCALLETQADSVSLLPLADDGQADPSPLLLVYTDNDSPDREHADYYRDILMKKVHAQLLCRWHHCVPGETQVLSAQELLQETTGGVSGYLGKDTRTRMCVMIRDNVFKRLVAFWEARRPGLFTLQGFNLTVAFHDAADQADVLEWLENPTRVGSREAPGFSGAPAEAKEEEQLRIDFD